MADTFQNYPASLEAPATKAYDVSVGTALDPTPRALFVGTGGDVTVELLNGGTVTFKNLADASVLPVRAAKVTAVSGAADIIGLI